MPCAFCLNRSFAGCHSFMACLREDEDSSSYPSSSSSLSSFFSFVVFLFYSYLQPVGIYPKKYEWAGTPLHLQGIHSPNLGGDCSLMVRAATIDFDDGAWECQVTASDFTTQDALTSEPVQLVVRGEWIWKGMRAIFFGVHIIVSSVCMCVKHNCNSRRVRYWCYLAKPNPNYILCLIRITIIMINVCAINWEISSRRGRYRECEP